MTNSGGQMNRILNNPVVISSLIVSVTLVMTGCGQSGDNNEASTRRSSVSDVIHAGKYTILGTRTDDAKSSKAKQNAETALIKYPELDCMVGLWAYNIPACLEAVKDAGKAGEVKLVSFDEDDATLQGIKEGYVHGTVVQQPFTFGYNSIKYLKALSEGDTSVIPDDKTDYVPTRVITRDNVDAFWTELRELKAIGEKASSSQREGDKKFAFVVNLPADFWKYAAAGCAKAEEDFNVVVDFKIPPTGAPAEQKDILEKLLVKGDVKGVAVCPLDPRNQTEIFNKVAEQVPLICQDSDAPESNRLFYLGTDNYAAGRKVGKLVKEALPDGGEVMIFVGKLDVLNAQQRRQGVIDELMDKPMPGDTTTE
jgi:ribose transport system substrate-binding protein